MVDHKTVLVDVESTLLLNDAAQQPASNVQLTHARLRDHVYQTTQDLPPLSGSNGDTNVDGIGHEPPPAGIDAVIVGHTVGIVDQPQNRRAQPKNDHGAGAQQEEARARVMANYVFTARSGPGVLPV